MTLEELNKTFATADDPADRMDMLEQLMAAACLPWNDVAAFLSRVLTDDPNSVVRHEAAFALGELRGSGRIGSDSGAEELCQAALHDRSIVVRHEATEALYGYAGQFVDDTLKLLLSDPSDEIRETAAISISWRQSLAPTSL